jgi:hypothetical protein
MPFRKREYTGNCKRKHQIALCGELLWKRLWTYWTLLLLLLLYYYYYYVYWVVKSRRNRWAGQVASMGARRRIYRVVVEKPREIDNSEDPGVDGKIILRWIFRKWDVGARAGLIWLRIGKGGGHW